MAARRLTLPWLAPVSIWSERALVERDTDPLLVAPHRAAAAHELIGLDHQHERLRHAHGIGDIDPRAARRDVAHRAVQAATAAEGEHAALEHPVSGLDPFLDHRRGFPIVADHVRVRNSNAKLLSIKSNIRAI